MNLWLSFIAYFLQFNKNGVNNFESHTAYFDYRRDRFKSYYASTCRQISVLLNIHNTVKSAYQEPAYKELSVIKNGFSFPNLYKELVLYTHFCSYSGYKEHIFIVPMSSL